MQQIETEETKNWKAENLDPENWLSEEISETIDEIESEHPYFWDQGELEESVLKTSWQADNFLQSLNTDLQELNVLIATDYDGPIRILKDEEADKIPESEKEDRDIYPGFSKAWNSIPLEPTVLQPAIISNRGTMYLQDWANNFLEGESRFRTVLAGEGGTTYDRRAFESDGVDVSGVELDRIRLTDGPDKPIIDALYSEEAEERCRNRIEFEKEIYQKAAEEGRKIVLARKLSPEIGTATIEGAGTNLEESRTGLHGDEYFSREYRSSIEDFWNTLQNMEESYRFEKDEGSDLIAFENNYEGAKALSRALTLNPIEIQLEELGDGSGKIAFTTNQFADEDYTKEESEEFMKSIAEDRAAQIVTNEDWWTDYILGDETSKENASRKLLEEYAIVDNPEETMIFYMGDKESDLFTGDNAYTFAQRGFEAEEAARKKGINYGIAENSVDYTLGVVDALLEYKKFEGTGQDFE